MHAGEALYTLYTLAVAVERRCGKDLALMRLTGDGLTACRTLAEYLNVDLPDSAQLEVWLQAKTGEQQAAASAKAVKPGRVRSPETEQAVANCAYIIENAENAPERCTDFANSVKEKAEDMQASIMRYNNATPAMGSALANMRSGLERILERNGG